MAGVGFDILSKADRRLKKIIGSKLCFIFNAGIFCINLNRLFLKLMRVPNIKKGIFIHLHVKYYGGKFILYKIDPADSY